MQKILELRFAFSMICSCLAVGLVGACTKSADPSKSSVRSPVSEPKSEPVAVPVATPVAEPQIPDFDISLLTKNAYKSDLGTRLLIFRDQRIEPHLPNATNPNDKSSWQIVRGSDAKTQGNQVSFKINGDSERKFAILDGGSKLVSSEPAETFSEQKPISPDGNSYISNSGVLVKFKGAKATFSNPKDNKTRTANDVKYSSEGITYTQTMPDVVKHILFVYNGGHLLIDVTSGQVITIYTLQ